MSGSGSESHEHVTNYTQTEKARSNRAYQPSLDASLRFPEDAPLAMNGDLHSTLADRVRERQTEGPKGRAKRELRRHLSKLDAKDDNLSEDALARARRKKVSVTDFVTGLCLVLSLSLSLCILLTVISSFNSFFFNHYNKHLGLTASFRRLASCRSLQSDYY
jgi:hypothetical protein